MKKIISFFLLIMCICFTSLGCSAYKDVSAEESVLALYKLYIQCDGEDANKFLGLTDEEVETLLDDLKSDFVSTMKLNFLGAGLTLTDEEAEELFNIQVNALKKLSPTISVESESEEEITIKLSTSCINLNEIYTTAATDIIAEAENASKDELSKLLLENLTELLTSAEPSAETSEETFILEKQQVMINNKATTVWFPGDVIDFSSKLSSMCYGVDS